MSDTLSVRAKRALEKIKKVHTMRGWIFQATVFGDDPEILENYEEIAEELVAGGYLTTTVNTFGNPDDDRYIELLGQDACDALKALRDGKTFVHPETGEFVSAKENVFVRYVTTDKIPVLPPPADPRAVALCQEFGAVRDSLMREKNRPDITQPEVDLLEAEARAWGHTHDRVARLFGVSAAETTGEIKVHQAVVRVHDSGLAAEHDVECPILSGEKAVMGMQSGSFQPSWKAQKLGWRTVQGKSWFQRLLLRWFFPQTT